jgi:hypothetical protein
MRRAHSSIPSRRLIVQAALAALLVGCARETTPVAATPSSPWDAIKQLPDWSGVWVLDRGWVASRDAYENDIGLTPRFEAMRQQARAERRQANLSTCLAAGAHAVLQHATLFEILYAPGRVTMLFEDGEVRRVYTDGRAHTPLAELTESYMGSSIGHWEGDTLVVETIGWPLGELFQNYGVRGTINTKLQERIRLNDKGMLQFDNVLSDPEIFVKPWQVTREYKRSPLPMTEPSCVHNNRDNGTEIDLTPPEA